MWERRGILSVFFIEGCLYSFILNFRAGCGMILDFIEAERAKKKVGSFRAGMCHIAVPPFMPHPQ